MTEPHVCERCGSTEKLRWGGTFVEVAPGVHRVTRVLWCAKCWGSGTDPEPAFGFRKMGRAA